MTPPSRSLTCVWTNRGLYANAILESGSFAEWILQPMSLAQATYDTLLLDLACTDLPCLMGKSTEEVYNASLTIPTPDPNVYAYAWAPTADGVEINTHPWIALANGDVSDVPIVHGTNSDEGVLFCTLEQNATLDELLQFWSSSGFSDEEIRQLETLYLDQTYPYVEGCSQFWWAAQRSLG